MSNEKHFRDLNKDSEWHKYNLAIENTNIHKENETKYLCFKERIAQFNNVITLDEARELAKKILPTAKEECEFKIGNAVCTVINKKNIIRISLNSDKEFICYDFV